MPTESLDMFTALEMLGRLNMAQWRIVLAALAQVADGTGFGTVTLVVVSRRVRRVEVTTSQDILKPGADDESSSLL